MSAAFLQPTFSYDSAGNPLLWNGSVLQWERGRQLKEFGGITFTYDAGGVRQSKTANGVITSYFTEGNRIHREERSDGKTLLYAYDASGLASITYNGTLYFVQKNFQGDIVALVDQNGNVVAKYVYDAWGNGKVCNASGTENTSSSFIGNINPFRYRGYYYDVETGLYYLQTRYYEPRAGRFLNADSVDYIAPDLIGGLNLYAYCNNNPVMYSDPEGHFFLLALVIGAFAGMVIGCTVAGVSATNDGAEGWELVGAIATGALVGGAIGAAVGIGVGLAATGAAAALGGGGAATTAGIMASGGAGAAALSGMSSAAVTTGLSIVSVGALAGVGVLSAGYLLAKWIPGSWPGDDPTIPPGDGFIWRGPGEVGSEFGEWYNPSTKDQLHPNLKHPLPKGPHWGWRNKLWKIFKDIFKTL